MWPGARVTTQTEDGSVPATPPPIGSESYVVGSHEFYLGYAVQKQVLLCLDAGHFHPTETIADKISATLLYVPELLLPVSRGVRFGIIIAWNKTYRLVLLSWVRCALMRKKY